MLARTRLGRTCSRAPAITSSPRSERAPRSDGVSLVVGGLSLGAVLSLILAAENPDAVAGVMVFRRRSSTTAGTCRGPSGSFPLADYLPGQAISSTCASEPPYGLKDEVLRKTIAAAYEGRDWAAAQTAAELGYAHFPLRLFCEMRHLIALCRRSLPHVRAPLLLLQAEEDDATSPRNAHYILEHVRSPRTELVMLANSYHVITADLDRAEVGASMTRFCLSLLESPPEYDVEGDSRA